MKILVINCGSSSLKYQLITMEDQRVLAKGLVERIGIEGSLLTQKIENSQKYIIEKPMKDHKEAINLVLNALIDDKHGVIDSMDEISAVGHRVVHGGEKYAHSVLIDDEVMKSLDECVKLAPLHNPPNIIGINACKELMSNTPMVAVFDTAFHQTMPEKAYIYALPYEYYKELGVRKYGFHGTSHKYVSEKAAEAMGKNIQDLKIITCHLGNGASIAAIKYGQCIDTSMGLTPLEGLTMGTRSGNIDPAIIPFLTKELQLTANEVVDMLNKKSGVLGISGISSDFRDLIVEAKKGNKRAKLAIDVFNYNVIKYIGAYAAAMNGIDCIVFTAGVGENSSDIREDICCRLEYLGVDIDLEINKVRGAIVEISSMNSRVKVYSIPTDEEMMIAKDTEAIVLGRG